MPAEPPSVADLAALQALPRTVLTVFVCGPGFGESVVVALPERGWLVIDGARASSGFPAAELLDRFRRDDEPIDAVVLTHPHADHYAGIVELLDDGRHGPGVAKIGCVAEYIQAQRTSTFDLELRERVTLASSRRDSLGLLDSSRARAVLERIRTEWEETPTRRLALSEGISIPLSSSSVTARALSPTAADVRIFFAPAGLRRRINQRANDLSAVLELQYGSTRLLLGGDLPDVCNGQVVSSGWRSVADRSPDLREHHGLKVPHHASRDAIPDSLIDPVTTCPDRTWIVTPYNRGSKLPSFEPDHGPDRMLAREDGFLLTALPRKWARQVPLPERTPRTRVQPRTIQPPGLAGLGRARAIGGDPDLQPLDCAWAASFDDAGSLVALYRGRAATRIVP